MENQSYVSPEIGSFFLEPCGGILAGSTNPSTNEGFTSGGSYNDWDN